MLRERDCKEADPATDLKPGVYILWISSTLISSIMYFPPIGRLSAFHSRRTAQAPW